MNKTARFVFAVLSVLICHSFAAFCQEQQPEDFDSWASQFRQSLSEEESANAQGGTSAPPPQAAAQDEPPARPDPLPKASVAPSLPEDKLVDISMGGSPHPDVVGLDTADVEALERRVDRLERDLHSLEDRFRTLDRTVDDLRRRR